MSFLQLSYEINTLDELITDYLDDDYRLFTLQTSTLCGPDCICFLVVIDLGHFTQTVTA